MFLDKQKEENNRVNGNEVYKDECYVFQAICAFYRFETFRIGLFDGVINIENVDDSETKWNHEHYIPKGF